MADQFSEKAKVTLHCITYRFETLTSLTGETSLVIIATKPDYNGISRLITNKFLANRLNQSRSQRIVWLLQECKGIDWDLKIYKRDSDSLAPPALKKIHPLGKSPVISIETPALAKPLVLAESGTIIEYLCDHFAQHLVPERYQDGKEGQVGGETEQWLRFRMYMHYAEGSLMSTLLLAMVIDNIGDNPATPFFIRPITRAISSKVYSIFLTNTLKTHFDFLEQQLATSPGDGKYLCGTELTAADIFMTFPLVAALAKKKYDAARYPKLSGYTKMMESHEGSKASIKKTEELTGEKYELLP
ncbi:bifunctional glutathione transferase/peroxidase [Friedmanniomyces endolithicus]|nr:bifunctional glutathione transferase/peroxidase [Friedmanniomyces endolithicus]